MLLFLDVISPIPEFCIIKDNKVIDQRKIIERESDNLSDYIFETYIKLNKDMNLSQNLKKIVITSGPGSYTSLRVGASFVSALKISKKILLSSFSAKDIIKMIINNDKTKDIGLFISSSKNQEFFCRMIDHQTIEYLKIDNHNYEIPKNIKTIFYNSKKIKCDLKLIKQYKFDFADIVLKNLKSFIFSNTEIIRPIYISNNKILN